MSTTEAGTAGASGGTAAPPVAPDTTGAVGSGVGGFPSDAGTPDPSASFLSSQYEPGHNSAPATNGEAPPPPQGEAAPAGSKERPDYVKEQFWDAERGEIKVEELAKSYGSLEHLLGKLGAQCAFIYQIEHPG